MVYPQVDGPHPRPRGGLALLGLEAGVAREHDGVRLDEALEEVERVRREGDVGH